MNNRIAIIGLGTLGGAVCKNISETDFVSELVIVDYDILESKNIHNSIYNATQIGDTKVDALQEIIKNNINVIPIKEKYKEGKTKLPRCDNVIDCRDIVCDRGNEIDARLYISDRILIFDCRKNIRTKHIYKGSYRSFLSKGELNKAGFFAAQIICSNQIKKMKQNKTVQRIDLNLLPTIINKSLKRSINNQIDIVYDKDSGSERLQCLEENINNILTLNKKTNIDVFIGDRSSSTSKLFKPQKRSQTIPTALKTKYTTIPINSLRHPNDLIQTLSSIVKKQNNIVNFIVTLQRKNGESFVELLEETGAA